MESILNEKAVNQTSYHHLGQRESKCHALVKGGQKAFVQQDFEQALFLTNQVLVEPSIYSAEGLSSSSVKLQSPLRLQYWTVCLTREVDIVDQAAALSLQAYYEYRPTTDHLIPFMECYQLNRAMTMEIAFLWAQFNFKARQSGDMKNAVNMTAELLFLTLGESKMDTELAEDMAWTLMVHMLPYSTNLNYVNNLVESILTDSAKWLAPVSESNYKTDISQDSLNCILSSLDQFFSRYPCLSTKFQVDLRQHLLSLQIEEVPVDKMDNTTTQEVGVSSWHAPHPDLLQWLAKFVRIHIRQLVRRLLKGDTQSGVQVLLVFLGMYMGWKHQRKLLKAGRVVGKAALFPLKEIIDAILPG